MKRFKQFLEEFSAGPTNAVSTGAIAGTGEKGGEPGVNLKKKKRVVLQPMLTRKMSQVK
jgi:hypothetical protein